MRPAWLRGRQIGTWEQVSSRGGDLSHWIGLIFKEGGGAEG